MLDFLFGFFIGSALSDKKTKSSPIDKAVFGILGFLLSCFLIFLLLYL